MYLSLEEFITKKKRKDGLNEFDADQRVKNMGLCINYVIEYFEKYLDPQKMDFKKAALAQKAAKLRKQFVKEYNSDVVDWLISIYREHGKRVDIAVKNFVKQDLTRLLHYTDEEWAKDASEFITENTKKMPYLGGEEEMVVRTIGNFIRVKNKVYEDFDAHNKLGDHIVKWLKETYRDYSVNLLHFALEYASAFFDDHYQYEYNRDFGRVERVREYDHRTESNLFDIDNLYEEIKDRPFIQGRKTELEILLMYVWLENIVSDSEYWNIYLNGNSERRRITNTGHTHKLILVRYKDAVYSGRVRSSVRMVDGHFDAGPVVETGRYLLSTEFSYGRRKFNSETMAKCAEVIRASRDGLPLLWFSKEWSLAFVHFIELLTEAAAQPEAIEVYPPFTAYMTTINDFLNVYLYFEEGIKRLFPGSKIMICNRNKAAQRDMKFLISSADDLEQLCEAIAKYQLDLRIGLDVSQLLETEAYHARYMGDDKIRILFGKVKGFRDYVSGIHVLGKMRGADGRKSTNSEDFDSMFGNSRNKKRAFLESLAFVFDDEVARYFVPEITGGIDRINSVVRDLQSAGFLFY